jgi:hypothetical protein
MSSRSLAYRVRARNARIRVMRGEHQNSLNFNTIFLHQHESD